MKKRFNIIFGFICFLSILLSCMSLPTPKVEHPHTRLVKEAVNEVIRVVPKGSKVWIENVTAVNTEIDRIVEYGTEAEKSQIEKRNTILAGIFGNFMHRRTSYGMGEQYTRIIDGIIDDVISVIILNDIIPVDRENIDLFKAEQNYQTSGAVSRTDAMSTNSQIGPKYLITFDIYDPGGLAIGFRLRMRISDMETGAILMQSNTGRRWQLEKEN